VPPGEFEMGEGGDRVKVRIDTAFALGTREVTLAEFRRFTKGHKNLAEFGCLDDDCPANQVNWYAAAAYCNWLSKEEGIPREQWCYEPNEKGEYAKGMKVKANSLTLSGYRLPAEAEWEYACRAGSVTGWSMGEAEDLLGKYAWYQANSATRLRPVGLARPNDLGLFDMHGNDWEWCHNLLKVVGGPGDLKNEEVIDDLEARSLRGGAYYSNPLLVRSAVRNGYPPTFRGGDMGFRVARTVR
jgi:formylglycine-generating enzyme required for sulfatase activity